MNMYINFIYLSGKAGSGKDTVANYLKDKYNIKVFHFATELKRICLENGWDGAKDEKGRELLQNLGSTFRAYDEDFWIKKLIDPSIYDYFIENYLTSNEVCSVSIADTRYLNEIKNTDVLFSKLFSSIKPYKFKDDKLITNKYSVRIERNIIGDGINNNNKQHLSETQLDNYKFDYYIDNNGTLDELYKNIDNFIIDSKMKLS